MIRVLKKVDSNCVRIPAIFLTFLLINSAFSCFAALLFKNLFCYSLITLKSYNQYWFIEGLVIIAKDMSTKINFD